MTTTEPHPSGAHRNTTWVKQSWNCRHRVFLLLWLLMGMVAIAPSISEAQETTPTPSPSVNSSATVADLAVSTPVSPAAGSPVELHIPSEQPSGEPVNDQIWMTYYPANSGAGEKLSLSRTSSVLLPNLSSPRGTPAVILLHFLGASQNTEMIRFARFLSSQGIAAVVVTLPYHMKRLPPGDSPLHHFVDGQVATSVQALSQSASDVSTVISWLERQPHIDSRRIALIGASLGAIVTHLVMGKDARVSAGVAMLGGGDLIESYSSSLAAKIVVRRKLPSFTRKDEEALRSVDPLTYAKPDQHRKVLMIQGARDVVIPPSSAEKLWEALGEPPIQWIDTNHLALRYAQKSAARAATEFLVQIWSGVPLEKVKVPRVQVPTVTAGFVFGLDTTVTPAVQLQVITLGTRNHMPILHGNVGVGLRGPFVGVAATVNQFVDVGIGRRLNGDRYRPYTSVHFAF